MAKRTHVICTLLYSSASRTISITSCGLVQSDVMQCKTQSQCVARDRAFSVCCTLPPTDGHSFWVVGAGLGDYNKDTDRATFNLNKPAYKDTVTLYPSSWAVIRFEANNPGAWPFHCHVASHFRSAAAAAPYRSRHAHSPAYSVLDHRISQPCCQCSLCTLCGEVISNHCLSIDALIMLVQHLVLLLQYHP
jgi:Multicopper oxidase